MEIMIFIGGVLVGFIFTVLIRDNTKTYGIMLVDHKNELCKVHITSEDLLKSRVKKVILKIDHNADLSREEQGL